MKIRLFSKGVMIALLAGSTLFVTSCEKNDDVDGVKYDLSGNATGAQEVPAVTTSATATLTGTYNATTNLLDYEINWTGLSGPATVAHFHGPALSGVSAPPVIDLAITSNGTTGKIKGSTTLHDTMEAHLLSGKLYYNIHTAAHTNGEIRGQVQTVPE